MLRYCTFSSIYTTTWCYATARSLQGIQLRDATLLHVLFKVYNYVMLRYCTVPSRYTTTWCYVHKLFFCTCALLSCYVAVAGAVGVVLASSFFDLKIFTQGVVFYMHLMLNSTHMCHLNMVSLQVSQVSMFIMHYANTFGRRVPKKKHLKLQARPQRVKQVMKCCEGFQKRMSSVSLTVFYSLDSWWTSIRMCKNLGFLKQLISTVQMQWA